MTTNFSGGKTRRKPPTMGKQLVNFITSESSAPFFVVYKDDANPRRIRDRLVRVVIQLPNSLSHPGPGFHLYLIYNDMEQNARI